jgi:hypothetical protein
MQKEHKILVFNNQIKLKKCLDFCLYLPKKALSLIPNSSIKLTFNYKGKTSYSNWFMKLIGTLSLLFLVIFTLNLLRKVGEIIEIKFDYVKH